MKVRKKIGKPVKEQFQDCRRKIMMARSNGYREKGRKWSDSEFNLNLKCTRGCPDLWYMVM